MYRSRPDHVPRHHGGAETRSSADPVAVSLPPTDSPRAELQSLRLFQTTDSFEDHDIVPLFLIMIFMHGERRLLLIYSDLLVREVFQQFPPKPQAFPSNRC